MYEQNHRLHYMARAAHATWLGDHAANRKIAALHYELALRYALLSVRAESADVAEGDRAAQGSTAWSEPALPCLEEDVSEPTLLQA